jgi:hypothetical protein
MMHLEFFFDGKSGCKRILRTQGRNSWTLRFLTENKFLSIKPLKIARQYLASARLIRVNVELVSPTVVCERSALLFDVWLRILFNL